MAIYYLDIYFNSGGGVMLPLVDNDVSGVVGQTVWGVDVDPDCANGW